MPFISSLYLFFDVSFAGGDDGGDDDVQPVAPFFCRGGIDSGRWEMRDLGDGDWEEGGGMVGGVW